MKDPRCPYCGWEVAHPEYEDGVSLCTHCDEYVVAEEAEALMADADLEAGIAGDFLQMEQDDLQDAYESDPYNYGYDDNPHDHAFPLDGEII